MLLEAEILGGVLFFFFFREIETMTLIRIYTKHLKYVSTACTVDVGILTVTVNGTCPYLYGTVDNMDAVSEG